MKTIKSHGKESEGHGCVIQWEPSKKRKQKPSKKAIALAEATSDDKEERVRVRWVGR
jgi:hypothetical protein